MSGERSDPFGHCGALSRAYDRDRWIAALFAPAEKRRYLHALSAFAYEIRRIKTLAREPLAGELRLTWWIEAVEGLREDEAAANPVSAALLETIAEAGLPKKAFESWLLARRDDLYQDPPTSPEDVAAAGRALESPLWALSALALGRAEDEAAAHAGAAAALLAAGLDARSALAAAQAALNGGPSLPAFAPLAALNLDARRAQPGRPPAALWRRQLAIGLWGLWR